MNNCNIMEEDLAASSLMVLSDDVWLPRIMQVEENMFLTCLYRHWRDFLAETLDGGMAHEEAEGILGVVWGSLACEMVEPCSPPWSL